MPLSFRRPVLVIFATAFTAFACGTVLGESRDPDLFSSSESADGGVVAENYIVDGCIGACATGLIRVRNRTTGTTSDIALAIPTPDIFFQWKDRRNLVVFYNARSASLARAPVNAGDINVTFQAYSYMTAAAASKSAKQSITHVVSVSDVSASASGNGDGYRRHCAIQVTGKSDHELSQVSVDLRVDVQRCTAPNGAFHNCGYVSSTFAVVKRDESLKRRILTSANITGASGYSTLPTGADQIAIRGQFLAGNAKKAIGALNEQSLSLDYNFDFNQLNLNYQLPTAPIVQEISRFTQCVGDADFM